MANNRQTRSMNEIESDLDENRDHLSDTLDALQQQLSPGDMVERAQAYIRDSGSQEFVDNLRVSVTRNPIPLTLVGAGVTWLMMSGASQSQQDDWTQRSNTNGSTVGDKASQVGSQAQATAHSARQGMGRAAQRSRDGMHSVTGGARRGAARVGSASRQGAARTKNGFDYMLREEPLASGLIGLAVGALIAASLPRTRREDELMGEQRDRFVDSAQSSGEEQAEKARHVAEAALDAGSDAASSEAERQGFRRPS